MPAVDEGDDDGAGARARGRIPAAGDVPELAEDFIALPDVLDVTVVTQLDHANGEDFAFRRAELLDRALPEELLGTFQLPGTVVHAGTFLQIQYRDGRNGTQCPSILVMRRIGTRGNDEGQQR